jgi:hypothetical protein
MSNLVNFDGSRISLSVNNVAEAKLAIKELRLIKKEMQIDKKRLAEDIKVIRFEYSQSVKSRGPMMRGGGGFGRFVRGFQTLSRSGDRHSLASKLQPLETQKTSIDSNINQIDGAILQLERYVHENA